MALGHICSVCILEMVTLHFRVTLREIHGSLLWLRTKMSHPVPWHVMTNAIIKSGVRLYILFIPNYFMSNYFHFHRIPNRCLGLFNNIRCPFFRIVPSSVSV